MRFIIALYVMIFLSFACKSQQRSEVSETIDRVDSITWETDYFKARARAIEEKKDLLIYFTTDATNFKAVNADMEATLSDTEVAFTMRNFVNLRIPASGTYDMPTESKVLLSQPEFKEMEGTPGVAILDFSSTEGTNYYGRYPVEYGRVVTALPFKAIPATPFSCIQRANYYNYTSHYKPWSKPIFLEALKLPKGRLQDRALIFAVKIHPDHYQSASSYVDEDLMIKAIEQSERQSVAGYRGHYKAEGHSEIDCHGNYMPPAKKFYIMSEIATATNNEEGKLPTFMSMALSAVACWRISAMHLEYMKKPSRAYGYSISNVPGKLYFATGCFVY